MEIIRFYFCIKGFWTYRAPSLMEIMHFYFYIKGFWTWTKDAEKDLSCDDPGNTKGGFSREFKEMKKERRERERDLRREERKEMAKKKRNIGIVGNSGDS